MRLLDSDFGQLLVNEGTELVAVLVQVDDHEVIGIGLGHLSYVLVPSDFDQ